MHPIFKKSLIAAAFLLLPLNLFGAGKVLTPITDEAPFPVAGKGPTGLTIPLSVDADGLLNINASVDTSSLLGFTRSTISGTALKTRQYQ